MFARQEGGGIFMEQTKTFYLKNAMYDTKSLQLTYILIITTESTKKESRIWIKGVTYLHEI